MHGWKGTRSHSPLFLSAVSLQHQGALWEAYTWHPALLSTWRHNTPPSCFRFYTITVYGDIRLWPRVKAVSHLNCLLQHHQKHQGRLKKQNHIPAAAVWLKCTEDLHSQTPSTRPALEGSIPDGSLLAGTHAEHVRFGATSLTPSAPSHHPSELPVTLGCVL